MYCKEFEKKIPDFINSNMSAGDMEEFLFHMQECNNCKEELNIQFLVTEGILALEDGRGFDLKTALDDKMNLCYRQITRRKRLIKLKQDLLVTFAIVIGIFVIWIC